MDVMLVGVDRPPSLLTPGPLLVGGMLLVAMVSVVTCGPTRGGHVTRGHAQRLGDGCTMKTDTLSDHGMEIVLTLEPGFNPYTQQHC